jgi:GNAT superfamily N-acetyltransferase
MESAQISFMTFGCRDGGVSNYASNIRLLAPKDRRELIRVFLTLEPSGRYCRFGRAANDASLVAHADNALANADWILGAFVRERIRGLVELYSSKPHGCVEAAFMVEKDWRRRGLGWALLQEAMQKASQCEAKTLRMVFSRENWPMRNLAHKARAKLDIVLDEMCADVALNEQIKFRV